MNRHHYKTGDYNIYRLNNLCGLTLNKEALTCYARWSWHIACIVLAQTSPA